MIDAHCHLNFHKFDENFDQVIRDAKNVGVSQIINAGTSIPSSIKAVELAGKYENLYAIVGIHPHHADKTDKEFEGELQTDWLKKLEKLAKNCKKVIGIGEIGLDYFYYKSNGTVEKKLQKEVFIKQVELAYKLNLPLQIHNRLAGEDVVSIIKTHKNLLKSDYPGMFHCFAGNLKVLKSVLDLGFYIGFDGNLTYQGLAPKEDTFLSEVCKSTPLERIIVETDSPFLTPVPLRGSQNEPKNVILVAQKVAEIKKIPYEKVAEITSQNTKAIFNL